MSNLVKKFTSGFVTNLKTIIQAAVLSVILWFVISIQIFPNITLHVTGIKVECEPTQYMQNENLRISGLDLDDITIQLQGKRYDISSLTSDDFTAKCDMSGIYESGEYTVNVRVEPVDHSMNCEILNNSYTAKVNVTRIISREMPVKATMGKLSIAEGMQIEGDLAVSPSTVVVSGEERLVESIGSIEAVAEYEDVVEESTEIRGNLIFYDKNGMKMINPAVNLSENIFTVGVPIYKVRTLPLNVRFVNFPTNFDQSMLDYSLSIEELTIASPDKSIDNLGSIDIGELSISSLTLKDIQGGVGLPIKLPDGYKNISGNSTVTVSFKNTDSFGQLGFTVPVNNISIINAPRDLDVKVLTNILNVNVVGLSSYVSEMTSDDIFATVNLLGVELSEGPKSVSVTFRLKGLRTKAWVTGEEYKVDIMISASSAVD